MPVLRRGQLEEFIKRLGRVDAHDELLQLFALLLADDIAAERGEFYRDFFFGHWIARITLRNIDAGGMCLAVISCDGYATRLELGEECFELFIRDHFHLVHDWNERLVAHAFLSELKR